MTAERLKQGGREKSSDNSKRVVLVTKTGKEGESKIAPVVVNETATGRISSLVIAETERLKERLKTIDKERVEVKKTKSYGRKRPKREISEIRKSKKEERREDVQQKLNVLVGTTIKPIKIVGQEIVLTDFSTKEEAEWWKFIQGRMFEVVKINQKHPGAIEWLIEAFTLRYKMRHALTADDEDKAKEGYNDFLKRFSDVPENVKDVLAPFFKEIRKQLT